MFPKVISQSLSNILSLSITKSGAFKGWDKEVSETVEGNIEDKEVKEKTYKATLNAVSEKTYSIAFSQILSEDDCCAEVIPINDWKIKNSQPADIPVLPVSQNSPIKVRLTPYDQTEQRVTMFPRINKNV